METLIMWAWLAGGVIILLCAGVWAWLIGSAGGLILALDESTIPPPVIGPWEKKEIK